MSDDLNPTYDEYAKAIRATGQTPVSREKYGAGSYRYTQLYLEALVIIDGKRGLQLSKRRKS